VYGPYMVVTPGAALLHASPEMGAKRLAMSMVVPETPVAFGHQAHDPVCLALAISSVDYEAHLKALEETLTLVADPPSRASLAQSTSGADAMERIMHRLGQLLPR
jgi:mannitol/fructose-specific phosphotransferase system IIA component (Ntr-type)